MPVLARPLDVAPARPAEIGPLDLRVGQPYLPGRTQWDEGACATYRLGDYELALFCPRVPKAAVEALEQGEAEFALTLDEPHALLGARFGADVPWSFAPLVVRMEDLFSLGADVPPTERALVRTALVETRSGLVRAIRCTTLTLDFTRLLQATLKDHVRSHSIEAASSRARSRPRLASATATADRLLARAVARSVGSA